MTNRELLRAPPEHLGPTERQRRAILHSAATAVPCPACTAPVDAVTATGLDIDQYSFGRETPAYRCPRCGAVLERVVPFIAFGPGWNWQLNREWLSDRLRKAALFDHEHEEGP